MTQNVKAANKTMSGLDGLGWPNPEDEPKPKKTMNSQLEIKLAPTPETDQCVKANKHLRFLQEDHYVGNSKTTYENPIVFLSRKLERERDELRKALSLAGKLCHGVHHPKSMQHGDLDPCPVEALIQQALNQES